MRTRRFALAMIIAATGALLQRAAAAEEIVVSNYGVSANGMPFAVAMAKGFFKAEGIDVTGIIASAGGGTTLRNMLASKVPFGEVNPGVVFTAIKEGANLHIVSDDVLTVAEFVWAVKPDSPIRSPTDFKGKKIGYTNPRSTSQALANLLLQSAGYKPEDAELVKTGGFGEGVAALELGQIDVAPIPEPLWAKYKSKFRVVASAKESLPPLDNVVGVATPEMMAAKGDFIRAVIRARRKAVEFMYSNPDESGDIVAKVYNLDPAIARDAVRNLITSHTNGVPYWGNGQIHLEGLKRMIEVQKSVGAISGDFDYNKIVDTRFLPDDIKAIK